MNIFVLDTDPAIAASHHCDQHLHKMILESAQMLSTAARARSFRDIESWLYKTAHPNHPCTKWVAASNHHMMWLCELAIELDSLRDNGTHASMDIIKAVHNYIQEEFPFAKASWTDHFVFAGPPSIEIRNLSVVEKYQMYYRQKHKQWALDKAVGMSYKNRPIPPFLQDLF